TDSNSGATIRITNNSDIAQTLTIRKLEHQQHFEDQPSEDVTHFASDTACDAVRGECPLYWLGIGPAGDAQHVQSFEVTLDRGEELELVVSDADETTATRWTGRLEVIAQQLGTTQIQMSYVRRPEGQWRGTVYYYTQFYEDDSIDAWAATPETRNSTALQNQLSNAFLQRWGAFRRGALSWDEMQAVMLATETGGWESASRLPECGVDACYLYSGRPSGLGDYSSDLDRIPVPTGVNELPFAMNLYQPDPTGEPGVMVGRIDSMGTLHYAGDPAVTLSFATSPGECDRTAFGECLAYIDAFSADVLVGGRYLTVEDDVNCSEREDATYELYQTPWLLPDFQENTFVDAGFRYRYECRDSLLPFDTSDGDAGLTNLEANLSLAASNPVPDGQSRRRSIELLDGVLVNQTEMVIIFRERMDSFYDREDPEGISAYGYVVLRRQPLNLDEDTNDNGVVDAYEGNLVIDDRPGLGSDPLTVVCDEGLLDEVLLSGESMGNNIHVARVIGRLISGIDASVSADAIDPSDDEQVHYLCVDTGLFDGGPDNDLEAGIDLSRNDNTCVTAFNNICEDGGWNANRVSDNCSSSNPSADCLVPLTSCALGSDLSDCGPRYTSDRDERVACPAASEVVFFTTDKNLLDQEGIADLPCQTNGTCQAVYEGWVSSFASSPLIQSEAYFRCSEGGAYCSSNRFDLRHGKTFFAASEDEALLPSYRAVLEQAFRYRTRFRSRSGEVVGFAPEICIPGSNQIPYCYDPDQIHELQLRSDCLVAIWDEHSLEMQASQDELIEDALDDLHEFLRFNFSQEQACLDGSSSCGCQDNPSRCGDFDGFERLQTELLVMMGDDAYTAAFSSRFDLAGSNTAAFEGELFEDGGINLSGIAGNEMVSLYQAVQYYSEALDRFYRLSPMIWRSVEEALAEQESPLDDHRVSFVEPEMVTTYMDRLLRASTQRSRAWSQIAIRYQSFNQPELARRVIERAYTATYLESIAITRMMQRIRESFNEANRPKIDQAIENAALRYGMALLDMRNVYSSINDQTTVFGLDPDFVPFPVMNPANFQADTAFEVIFRRAMDRVQIARQREEAAIDSNRSYETDTAQFQAELVRIRNTYESQLGDLCGTFAADDGRIYPAIRRYATLDSQLAAYGDPCGLVGNGAIFEALVQIDLIGVEVQQLQERYSSVYQRIEIENQRVDERCELIDDTAAYTLCLQTGDQDSCDALSADADIPECPPEVLVVFDDVKDISRAILEGRLRDAGQEVEEAFYGSECSIMSLEQEIQESREVQDAVSATMDVVSDLAQLTKCVVIGGTAVGSDCQGAALGSLMVIGASAVSESYQALTQRSIAASEREVSNIQYMIGNYQTVGQCDELRVDSEARVREMMLELNQLDLEALRLQYQIQLQLSQLERLNNEATRLQLEQEETELLTINVEAARNDPNVRIYRNDAVINADYAFQSAMALAYQATRIYEYYTTSSYAARDQLFLIRMVGAGDYNLENYMLDLQDAFYDFEQQFGAPDLRVEILSLRDDLMSIPLVDENGIALSQNDRVGLLRERLADPALLDANGYLTIPFSTDTGTLSPLTRAHRIQFIEADVIASDYGDEVGRVYLRQLGTGSLDRIGGGAEFYRFPNRSVSVVDVFFGGTRYFDTEVYRSYTFLERPFANTAWELVINQRDETANQDIDLQSLTDIRLYIYYNDFTVY
ncbi:MAG: hypothetical protein KC561_00850, partial [Myxococcales bacterium]|nr:hypothetical protein [Myxococcales bacterium]